MKNLKVLEAVVVVSQVGFVLAAAVAAGLFAGSYLDSILGTSPLFVLVGVLAGTAGGMYSIVQLLRYVSRKRQSGQ